MHNTISPFIKFNNCGTRRINGLFCCTIQHILEPLCVYETSFSMVHAHISLHNTHYTYIHIHHNIHVHTHTHTYTQSHTYTYTCTYPIILIIDPALQQGRDYSLLNSSHNTNNLPHMSKQQIT